MSNRMDLDHSHFKVMKKVVADIEKDWKLGAIIGVKDGLTKLNRLSKETESVIKNQLYYNLKESHEKETENGQKDSDQGWGSASTEE